MTTTTPPTPTFDSVWLLLQEIAQQTRDSRLETDRAIEKSRIETDRAIEESRLQTDRAIEKSKLQTDRALEESRRETDRVFLQSKIENDRQMKALSTQLGNLGGRLGEFVEHAVRPAAIRLFRERGLDVHQVIGDLNAYDDNGQFLSQIDLLVINAQTAIVVECKSRLSVDDVNEHIERMDAFKHHFPRYADLDLLGAVAAMVIPDDVARYAYRKGLFVMAQNGDGILIRNDGKFSPKTW